MTKRYSIPVSASVYATKRRGVLEAFEPDGLVVGNAGAFTPSPFEKVFDIGVAFQAGNKEDGVYGQIVVPGVICKAAVETDKGTLWKLEGFVSPQLISCTLPPVMSINAGIATKVSERLGYLLKKDAEQAIEIILEDISRAISDGRRVEIRGFGTFSMRERQSRTTANPKSGKVMDIPARKTTHFTMSGSLKAALIGDQE